jgi:hypothetical protein
MRMIVIAAVLVAGCASATARTPSPNPRIAHFEQESRKIEERENRCIGATVTPSDREIANVPTTPGATADSQTNKLADERDRRLLECRANADRERAELSARERAAYQDRVQEQHDRNSLMMTLITSRPR